MPNWKSLMLKSEFKGKTKITNWRVRKLKVQQQKKVDIVFWSYQQTPKQSHCSSILIIEIVQSKHFCFIRLTCALPLAGNMIQLFWTRAVNERLSLGNRKCYQSALQFSSRNDLVQSMCRQEMRWDIFSKVSTSLTAYSEQ